MTRECPSCGNMVEDNQMFCPMCGTKIPITNTINENKYLKDEIAKAEAYATAVLYTNNRIVFKEISAAEVNFMNIIDKFPSSPESYIAYVNFTVKLIERILNRKQNDDYIYLRDLQGSISKCNMFLNKALQYANNDTSGNTLQEISRLQSHLDSFKLDETVVKQNEKNKKIANRGIYAIIIAAIVVGLLCWFFLNFT